MSASATVKLQCWWRPSGLARQNISSAIALWQVAGIDGAVAVHVMPRYVLHNLLDVPLQCKQAGTAVERELVPGVRLVEPKYAPCTSPPIQSSAAIFQLSCRGCVSGWLAHQAYTCVGRSAVHGGAACRNR